MNDESDVFPSYCALGLPNKHRRRVFDARAIAIQRAEEYIEAHLEAPFDIERIAEVTGISTRSIYRLQAQSRVLPHGIRAPEALAASPADARGRRNESDRNVSGVCVWLQRRGPFQPGILKGLRQSAVRGAGKTTALDDWTGKVVERKGIEPSTYALRTHRSPN